MREDDNDLNSLLIEGYLTGDPAGITNDNDEIEECTFTIRTVSLRRDHSDFFDLRVITRDAIAQNVFEYLRKDRRTRIVGHLHADETGVYVEAEHVEYRPARRVSQSTPETANA